MKQTLDARTLNVLSTLGAFSMFLSTVEYLFPKPIPFMRLGLANLPLIIALEILPVRPFVWLVALKVLGQAIINGTLASYVFLFSLAGSIGSAAIMFTCYRLLNPRISAIGISLFGALASNATQIALSVLFVFGPAAWRILPSFLAIGIVSGLVIGVIAQRFSEESSWWRSVRSEFVGEPGGPSAEQSPVATPPLPTTSNNGRSREDVIGQHVSPSVRFWIGLIIIPGFLMVDSPTTQLVLLVLFAALVRLAGKRIRHGYYMVLILSIVAFHLMNPTGRILASIGPLIITEGALTEGLTKGLRLGGLVLISLFSVTRNLHLPGRLGGLIVGAFYQFERIMECGERPSVRGFISSLDGILMRLFPPTLLNDSPGRSGTR